MAVTNPFTMQLHHIGARGGSSAIPATSLFEQHTHWTWYDADQSCIDQISQRVDSQDNVSVLPFCVGGHNGTVDFHHNYDPNTNSIYKLNEKYRSWYLDTAGPDAEKLDYILGEVCQTMRSEQMTVHTLQSLYDAQKINAPEYLSMDVQGAEYDVLTGAESLVNEHVLCAQLEVEFRELYKDQKLFHHIDEYLQKRDFELVKLGSITEASSKNFPVHCRGDGLITAADAVYIKSIQSIVQKGRPDAWIKLYKLAMFALCHHLLEYALESITQAMALEPEDSDTANISYIGFLKELQRASLGGTQLQTFNEFYTYQESTNRYDTNVKQKTSYALYYRYMDRIVDFVASKHSGKRVCFVPNGKITREYVSQIGDTEIPVEVFDNHDTSGQCQPTSALAKDDVVIITSLTYQDVIKQQLMNEFGLAEHNLFGLNDLRTPGAALKAMIAASTTEIEQCLESAGLHELSEKVRKKRGLLEV